VTAAGDAAKINAAQNVVTAVDSVVTAAVDETKKSNATLVSVLAAVSTAVAQTANQPPALVAAVDRVLQAAAEATTQDVTITPQILAYLAKNAVPGAAAAAADQVVPISGVAKIRVKGGLVLSAASPGTWANNLKARVDYQISPDFVKDLNLPNLQPGDLFNLTVYNSDTREAELFRNVSIDKGPRLLKHVLEAESNFVRVEEAHKPDQYEDPDRNKPEEADIWKGIYKDRFYSAVSTRGGDGDVLKRIDFTGNGARAEKRGLYALLDADIFNLLCIPPHVIAGGTEGDIEPELIDEAVDLCVERRALFLIDSRSDWNTKNKAVDDARAGRGIGAASKNAAIFFPRLAQPDPFRDNQLGTFVPCGAVAGVFARTDTTRGVWKAPAGLDAILSGVPQLSVTLNDLDNGELNKLGVNCLRTMPAAGRVVWGSRTRLGDDRLASEWKYIPVRRTALFIEESLYRGTQWVVFEPNDEPLWAQIRLNVGAFMHNLFRQGAFQGTTPREAYFVKCDKETTTQNDINLGIVNILVGFAPLKPAEFVVIKLQQIAGNIET
jgi:phage tail sheath protein FI